MQFDLCIDDCLVLGSAQVTVLEVTHDSVKLGINDPKASPTYREEILFIRSENDDRDDGNDADAVFEPLEIHEGSPFAISFV
jgi:carbon storage regulator CsrA